MNPIETLTALDGLRRELHCQQEKIACLEEAARYLSPAGDGIGSSSGPSDRVGKMAGQIADEKAELERMEERYSQAVAEAAGVLSGLADPVEREVLTKRYIAGKNWTEISGSMGYTHRNIRRLKQSAFQKLSANVR
ncbi:MAG: hypothetical protein HFE44_17965 [Oscillospiraceae bacterium]|jgi:DNA-directed RNA polymerase specialized sigma24 family protein|nr:hypothetical protein [Oscillospiraceae bacterium]